MAATAMLNLYNSWDQYDRNDHITFDEDRSCALSSFRQLPAGDKDADITLTEVEPELISPCKPKSYAVEIADACFTYGTGNKTVTAMKNISLKVPTGEIYGLLGPSGCGKTTLLRCLVGRLKVQSGTVKVFGVEPGKVGTTILGPRIGYMPQEIALFPDFTIDETLFFFARLYGMKEKVIRERIRFLLSFLELPDKRRLVGNLSGGQKRRVSLAVSLVHAPPLLILDEPTVGVDPVLRQTIWKYLIELTKNENLTVIITTHYIEEARDANGVGLMRFGRLLVESSPEYLLMRYKMNTLEDVFLELCKRDAEKHSLRLHPKPSQNQAPDICITEAATPALSSIEDSSDSGLDSIDDGVSDVLADSPHWMKRSASKTNALFQKNVIRLRRNLPVLLFQFLLPSIEVIIFCLCIGRDPQQIPVAIFNEESPIDYSELFLNKISNNSVTQLQYPSMESAMSAVKSGHAWGAMCIGRNFSQSLQLRVMMAGSVDNMTIESSNVDMYLDMTNQIIGYHLQRTILYAWKSFSSDISSRMGQNPAAFEFPVKFETPIYGLQSPSFTEFMAPGVLLSISFLAAVALTALAFVMERKEGLLERSLVAGVTSYEFLMSHVLTQLLVLVVQIFLLLLFTFCVFNISSHGPFIWVVLLTMLQGTCGMAYGLMISAICKEENSATMLALGSFYPNLLMSGTVWPVQAMPAVMKYVSYVLPQTIPIESMRYILSRGWDPSYPEVATGFGITIAWTVIFLFAAVLIFNKSK